jgi:hypothetical protein
MERKPERSEYLNPIAMNRDKQLTKEQIIENFNILLQRKHTKIEFGVGQVRVSSDIGFRVMKITVDVDAGTISDDYGNSHPLDKNSKEIENLMTAVEKAQEK